MELGGPCNRHRKKDEPCTTTESPTFFSIHTLSLNRNAFLAPSTTYDQFLTDIGDAPIRHTVSKRISPVDLLLPNGNVEEENKDHSQILRHHA